MNKSTLKIIAHFLLIIALVTVCSFIARAEIIQCGQELKWVSHTNRQLVSKSIFHAISGNKLSLCYNYYLIHLENDLLQLGPELFHIISDY